MPSSAFKKYALRSEEHTSELQSHDNLVCRLLLEKKMHFRALTERGGGARPRRPDLLPVTVVYLFLFATGLGPAFARCGRVCSSLFFFLVCRPPPNTSPPPPTPPPAS